MSKSYKKKVRLHVAYGNNTEFYRSRRRRERRVNKNVLKSVVNVFDVDTEDLDRVQFEQIPKRDTWREPTDGSYVVDHEIINRRLIDGDYSNSDLSWIKKSCRGLKWFKKIIGMK